MTHLAYIVASYAVSAVVLLGMVAGVLLDLSIQQRKLRTLEAERARRRSDVPR